MCDSSTVGSTPPCQGGGRGFESRLSLLKKLFATLFSLYTKVCKKSCQWQVFCMPKYVREATGGRLSAYQVCNYLFANFGNAGISFLFF